ncbi:MAG: hypothetical protein LJE95_10640 [Acidobacteria bacterium]|nr:hypothetical protein [Acidobacteriota bacterium]
MKQSRFFGSVMGIGLLLIGVAASLSAAKVPGFDVQVLVKGVPLAEYLARGTTYIEAQRGREYSIRLKNRTGARVAVALAVDGLNTIDARTTTAGRAAKWILGPYETVTIDGWQTSTRAARRFFFTSEERSYGAWLGKTANLGVIEAVVFRERAPRPIVRHWHERCRRSSEESAQGEAAPRPTGRNQPRSESAGTVLGHSTEKQALSDELAATGIGRRTSNPVRRVEFHAESTPMAHVRLRYEYRDQLVKLGVLPDPDRLSDLARRESSRGFTDMAFAPDPFARR